MFLTGLFAFFIYAADYYRADDTVLPALRSDEVQVEKNEFGLFFDGPSDSDALVFYPGGKVEETAYAPMLHMLAADGIDVFLLKMPFRLALLKMNAAEKIMQRYDYENWYVGGHSLGGVAAAGYAAGHDVAGVVLLAAYPTKTVNEPMLILYGSEDGVINRRRLAEAHCFGDVVIIEITGGNHAGFGQYGDQKGDGPATISSQEQQRIAVEAVMDWIA